MKIAFKTLGCKANLYESDKLRENIQNFQTVTPKDNADIFIINTCTVTKEADRKSKQAIKSIKTSYPDSKVIVFGCGVINGVFAGMKEVDFLFKNRGEVEEMIKILQNKNPEQSSKENFPPSKNFVSRTRAMIKIQDGCDNFCSYCILPYVRGRERNFDFNEILDEIKQKEKAGFNEIVITGINATHYNYENKNFADLLEEILNKINIPRIRISSIEPQDFSAKFLNLFKNPRICGHAHMSLQSGSDKILKKMNRKYDTGLFLEVCEKIKNIRPDIAITTDIIVGFPEETEEDFIESYNFARNIGFAKIHVFRFSPREGTRAAKLIDNVSKKQKIERSNKISELSQLSRTEFIKSNLGKEKEILFESKIKNGKLTGLTDNYIKVEVESEQKTFNKIRKVLLKEVSGEIARGELL